MLLQDYRDISASSDRTTFEARLVKFAQSMDFGIVTAAIAVDRPGQSALYEMVGNTPDTYKAVAGNADTVKRDPVVRRMKSMSVPFTYNQQLYASEGAGDIWETMAPFGFKTGVAMALHLPASRHFLLGVDRDDALPENDERLTRMLADLQLLAVHAQEAAIRVLLPSASEPLNVPSLTPREREVLLWTKEGKSAWAVGEILSMSEATVNFHIRNVMRKFGVSGKHMAILRAISLGLI
jgi:DNA-binding CsgD family transcriptional regulator